MAPPSYFISLSAVLFAIGASGVLLRRNAIVILMSIEIMLNAANLAFAAFAFSWGNLEGQIFVFMILAVAAAEVAIGLAIMVAIYRERGSIDVDRVNLLKW